MLFSMAPITIHASAERAFSTATSYCGSATAANMPMIKTTTNNSIKVNPSFFRIDIALLIRRTYPTVSKKKNASSPLCLITEKGPIILPAKAYKIQFFSIKNPGSF